MQSLCLQRKEILVCYTEITLQKLFGKWQILLRELDETPFYYCFIYHVNFKRLDHYSTDLNPVNVLVPLLL